MSKIQEFYCAYDELWEVGKVVPHPRNPNQHPDNQLKLLAKIIEGHGWRAPITVSKRSGYVIRGHGRLAAALLLGCDKVPIDLQEYASEAEEYADMIADNRIAELAEIDQEELNSLIHDLDSADYDMSRLGFSDKSIQEMLAEYGKETLSDDNFDVDKALEEIKDPITKRGDVWVLGNHKLMCGDSTNKDDVNKLMGEDEAEMVLTDPPYNVDYQGGTKKKLKIQNDKMGNDEFHQFLYNAFCRMFEHTKKGGACYVWYADRESINFRSALLEAGWEIKQGLIWVKNSLVLGRSDYQWRHEPLIYSSKPGAAHRFYGGRKLSTILPDNFPVSVSKGSDGIDLLTFNFGTQTLVLKVEGDWQVVDTTNVSTCWHVPKPPANREHPTMKPIALVAKGILNSSKEGELVMDLFGGSGSTLIACEGTRRVCRTMELDEKYCDVIIRRWEALTNKKAVLESEVK